MKRFFSLTALGLIMVCASAIAQTAQVSVEGLGGKTATLSTPDLKQMERTSITVTDPKTKAVQHYEGVLLSTVLAKVGAPTGKTLHGVEFRDYVEVSATDNYRVIFSLAEVDSPTHANQVLLADTLDGKPLEPPQGPFKHIAPDDIRPERWVRMVARVRIRQIP
jgi:hypothetical protein